MDTIFRLLICGSRQASQQMVDVARAAVLRAKELGWRIVVGDAYGVDQAVVYACCRYTVPFECYGITPRARNFTTRNTMLLHWETIGSYFPVNGNYLHRDRVMVENADRVFAIWNGYSRGTKYTYDYAITVGKPADVRTFRRA